MDFDLKLKLNGKRLYPTKSAKYLGIKIGKNLIWIDHINDTAIKVNRADAMLFKVREFVNIKILSIINLFCYLRLSLKLCKQSMGSK